MAMFSDLNKLNTKQEKTQQVKIVSNTVPTVPSKNTQAQSTPERSSPSGLDTTIRPRRQPNATDMREQGDQQPDAKTVPTPSQQQINQPVDRLTSRLTNQSTSQLTNQSTYISGNRVVGRPKAFYITERLDARLDDAVKYLQDKHGIRKVDRSTIVNALLDNEANWAEENLELLVSRVLSLLTSRLTS
jgi:hypothetical protein